MDLSFLDSFKNQLESRGIPIIAIPVILVIIVALGVGLFFLQAPGSKAFKLTILSAGEPVAGVVVEVFEENGDFVEAGISDANGVVLFEKLPAKKLGFKITKTGSEPIQRVIDLSKAASLRVELQGEATPTPRVVGLAPPPAVVAPPKQFSVSQPPKGKLAVIVRNNEGKPVDAKVTVSNSDSAGVIAEGNTRNGLVVFSDLESGTVLSITATASGYLAFPDDGKKKEVTLKAGTNSLNIVMTSESSANSDTSAISVVDSEGKAVAGAKVWVLSIEHVLVKEGETGSGGLFNATVPSDLSYYAVAKKDGYLVGRTGFSAGDAAVIILTNATAENSAQLTVFAKDEDGKSVSDANVSVKTEAGEFIAPAKTTSSDGRAVFAELEKGSTVLAKVSKGNRIGEQTVALGSSSVQVNVTLTLHVGVIKVTAVDALSNIAVANPFFTAFYQDKNVASCNGNNCSLLVRANAPIKIQSTASGYFPSNITLSVTSDGTATGVVQLIPTSSVDNSDARIVRLFDIADPGVEAKRFKKGHDYVLQINFVSTNLGANDDGGLLVRADDGIVIKGVDRLVRFSGGTSTDCSNADEQPLDDSAYSWIDLRTKGSTSLTYSITLRVTPDAVGNATVSFSTYAIKGGQWLRNPVDPALGVNETSRWCQAQAKQAISLSTSDPDVTCTSAGCIELLMSQGSQRCGFEETGEYCEGFQASSDENAGNLLLHYTITPYAVTKTGNNIVLGFDPQVFDFVEMTVPSHGATIFDAATAKVTGVSFPGSVSASADKAVARADFAYYGVIEGTIILAPKRPASTSINLSFSNANATIRHSVPLSVGAVAGGLWFKSDLSAKCNPAELDCSVFCYKPVGNCEQYEFKFNSSFSQAGQAGGQGMSVFKSSSPALEDALEIKYSLEDKIPPYAGGELGLSGYGDDLEPVQSTPPLLVEFGAFKRPVTEFDVGPGKKVEGTVKARVKKTSGKISLKFTYKTFSLDYYLVAQLPPLPSKYVVKYEYNNGQGTDSFRLENVNGENVSEINLNSQPILPGDAVYLLLDYAESKCAQSPPVVNIEQNPCFRLESTGFKTEHYDSLLKKQVVMLKYDALLPGCDDFEGGNPNKLKSNSIQMTFGIACTNALKAVPVSVTPENSVPAVFIAYGDEVGFANRNCGGGAQPGGNTVWPWVIVNNREYGSLGFVLEYRKGGFDLTSQSLAFNQPGAKAFAGESFKVKLNDVDLTNELKISNLGAGVSPIKSFDNATDYLARIFSRRSSDDQAFPYTIFKKGTQPVSVHWPGPGGRESFLIRESGCAGRTGIFDYTFDTAKYASVNDLITKTTGTAMQLPSSMYFVDQAQACPAVSLCGASYTSCGKCVLTGEMSIGGGMNLDGARCRKSGLLFPTQVEFIYGVRYENSGYLSGARPGIPIFHYPTCNIVVSDSGGDGCRQNCVGCCDYLYAWNIFRFKNMITGTGYNKGVCAGGGCPCDCGDTCPQELRGTSPTAALAFDGGTSNYDSRLNLFFDWNVNYNNCGGLFGGDLRREYPMRECVYATASENPGVCNDYHFLLGDTGGFVQCSGNECTQCGVEKTGPCSDGSCQLFYQNYGNACVKCGGKGEPCCFTQSGFYCYPGLVCPFSPNPIFTPNLICTTPPST